MPTPPAGFSIAIPTGPPVDYTKAIQDDPFYLQQTAWLTEDAAIQRQRLEADKTLAQQLYDINVKQATQSIAGAGGGGGGDYGLAAAQKAAELAREKAAHDNALQEEYIRESLASRGMKDSGQLGVDQGIREFDYSMLQKQIAADLEARRSAASSAASAAASSRANAQAGLTLQLQEMALRHGAGQTSMGYQLEDLDRGVARDTGAAAMATYQRLMDNGSLKPGTVMAAWDDASGLYRTSDGQYFDQFGNPTSYNAPPAYQPPAAPSYQPSAPAAYTPYTPPPASYDPGYGYQPQGPARPGQSNQY